jgi:peptidoglycan/xylan/chitin deacetylase (PgdA/CDA1 family)
VKNRIRRALDVVLARGPAQPWFLKNRSDRLTVLAYHGVDDPKMFGRQLDLLPRLATPVSLDQVLDAFSGGEPLPRNPVLITFDDGERSILEVGLPMLAERRLPAVVFVVAGLLDTDEPFWWVEVERRVQAGGRVGGAPVPSAAALVRRLKDVPDAERESALHELRDSTPKLDVRTPQLRRSELPALEASGITIGNHSLKHRCLANCSESVIAHEVAEAHGILTTVLGHSPRSFAYPDGSCDPRVRTVLAGSGCEAAFLFDHKVCRLPVDDPLQTSRVRVNSWTDLDRFAIIVSGLHPAIHHLVGRA